MRILSWVCLLFLCSGALAERGAKTRKGVDLGQVHEQGIFPSFESLGGAMPIDKREKPQLEAPPPSAFLVPEGDALGQLIADDGSKRGVLVNTGERLPYGMLLKESSSTGVRIYVPVRSTEHFLYDVYSEEEYESSGFKLPEGRAQLENKGGLFGGRKMLYWDAYGAPLDTYNLE